MERADTRRDALHALVRERGFLRVADASRLFEVSEVTIRADLTALEESGLVMRTHGGAMPRGGDGDATAPTPASAPESALEQSLARESAAKRAIGAAAAALVTPGQSILLDVGSTALAVAQALVARTDLDELSIITNGLSIALALEPAMPRFTVVLTGGTLRPLQHSLVNPGASEFLEQVHADLALIGCNGVDLVRGVTNVNYPEAEVKRRMVQSSKRRVLIADGSKLGQAHLGLIGPLSDFELLVTGGEAPRGAVRGLREHGLEVIVAATGPQ